jgi:hypothetical protein
MTTVASPTQVRCGPDERLVAHCATCAVDLVQAPHADVAAALVTLDAAHPAGRGRRHRRTPPAGWDALPRAGD